METHLKNLDDGKLKNKKSPKGDFLFLSRDKI